MELLSVDHQPLLTSKTHLLSLYLINSLSVLANFLLLPKLKLLHFLFSLSRVPSDSNMAYSFPSIWFLPNAISSENSYLIIILKMHPPSHDNVHLSLIPLYFSSWYPSPPEVNIFACLLAYYLFPVWGQGLLISESLVLECYLVNEWTQQYQYSDAE